MRPRRREIRGTLNIGVIPTVTAIDIPAALGTFHHAHPAVRMSVHVGGSHELITAIETGTLDIAVLGMPDTMPVKSVRSRVLARERLVAVVSTGHALARRRRIRIAELANETFVDFPKGTPGCLPSDLAFQAAGMRRDVPFEATSTELILGLVEHNLVIALLSPKTIPPSATLRSIPVTGGPTRVEYLAWSSFNVSPAARAFLEILGTPSVD